MRFGGIEAGGTKWTCAIGDGTGRVSSLNTFPTTTPDETIGRAVDFFRATAGLSAVGIGSFGPIEVNPASPSWGSITNTPKPGWSGTSLAPSFQAALGIPIGFDTDVNAAAIGEGKWGAAIGLDTFCYVTVGTGIGGGSIVNGRPLHGLAHPELGHIRIPHDRDRDPFEGACPFHGDCFEGLASGEALRERWGRPAEQLTGEEVWRLEAEYLALGLVSIILTLSPERIVLGGGVSGAPGLLTSVRRRLRGLLGGYIDVPQLGDEIGSYLVRPGLGDRAGVIGAIGLAKAAAEHAGAG